MLSIDVAYPTARTRPPSLCARPSCMELSSKEGGLALCVAHTEAALAGTIEDDYFPTDVEELRRRIGSDLSVSGWSSWRWEKEAGIANQTLSDIIRGKYAVTDQRTAEAIIWQAKLAREHLAARIERRPPRVEYRREAYIISEEEGGRRTLHPSYGGPWDTGKAVAI